VPFEFEVSGDLVGALGLPTLAIRSWASIKIVKRLLGYATATMTLDNHGHLCPDELDEVARRLAQSVSTGCHQTGYLPARGRLLGG
jgi:hypothetical protein